MDVALQTRAEQLANEIADQAKTIEDLAERTPPASCPRSAKRRRTTCPNSCPTSGKPRIRQNPPSAKHLAAHR